ncbi:MAG: AAA family ATPase [Nitrospiraceae bacterium]|nr:AAA family ATPase [Nitrospiraceae bacterium]
MARILQPHELFTKCDPADLQFNSTDDLVFHDGTTIGQDKALTALDFGLSLCSDGFNIFALGESGTGKMRAIKLLLAERASSQEVPSDWCYVYNFKEPDEPSAVSVEPGRGVELQKDMDDLVKSLRTEIPKAFESKEYEKQKSKIIENFQKKQREFFSELEQEAMSKGFALRKSPSGLVIVPVKKDGEPLTEEEFNNFDDATKASIDSIGKQLQEKLDDLVRVVRVEEKGIKEELLSLDRQIGLGAVGHFIEELKEKYSGHEKITAYFEAVKEDMLSHLDDFKTTEEQPAPLPFMKMPKQEVSFSRYSVNTIVNNSGCKGAPIVIESNPTYLNLAGRVEYKMQYGFATTDFTMIKAGSLHKANGGYLVINALDLLKNILAYDGLKRAVKNREIKLEDVWEQYRLMSSSTLKPEAIPLDVKIILVGHPYIYYMLYNLDPDYKDLFKVKADFDSRMDLTEESVKKYAYFVAACQKEEKLLPFDNTGVSKVVEYGVRLAGHQKKLSTRFSEIADLVREAHYWATKSGASLISAEHVTRALNEKIFRSNRIEEKMRELMLEDVLIVDTSGQKAGQVNGLAVLDLGDYSFGKPSRITASTYTGKAGIVNIERETKMSGKIHEKAIMILSGYLGRCFARRKPLSLSASITFEQLYEMVEGDSATCAEYYALISSISGVPLKQSLAVTGSMDQSGEVQPIGGVNEKIEGFFDLCRIRGLDGTHGVIIPRRNIANLMLRHDVVEAVQQNKFVIHAIDRVEEGLEILAGMNAGGMSEDGTYPEGTLYNIVASKLLKMSEALKPKKDEEKNNSDEEQAKPKSNDEEGGAAK